MFKRFLAVIAAVALFPILSLFPLGGAAADARADFAPEQSLLRFGSDGTFTILLLSDIQDTQYVSPYLIRSLNSVLNDYTPDLVVLLGDQFCGYHPLMRLGEPEKNVQSGMEQFLAPIVSRNIPFALVFGNHDVQAQVPLQKQMELYQRYPQCLSVSGDADITGCGNYLLPVLSEDASQTLLNLFFFDSGDYLEDGGYGMVHSDQIAWYQNASNEARALNGGRIVPAAVFQHIIVPEVYDALDLGQRGDKDVVKGVGYGEGNYYRKDSQAILLGELNEAPCPSTQNDGLFDAFLTQGDVFAAFFGHDHINSFLISHHGIDLVAVPGATYTSYNSRQSRGVKLVRFNDINVENYETIFVPFSDYESLSALELIPYYLSTTTRLPNLLKVALLFLLMAGAAVWMILRGRGLHKASSESRDIQEPSDSGYDEPTGQDSLSNSGDADTEESRSIRD